MTFSCVWDHNKKSLIWHLEFIHFTGIDHSVHVSPSNLYQNGVIKNTWTHRASLINFFKLVKCELDFRFQVGNATKSLTEFVADGICNNFPYWFCCIFKVQQNPSLILLHFQSAIKSHTDFIALSKCNKISKRFCCTLKMQQNQ